MISQLSDHSILVTVLDMTEPAPFLTLTHSTSTQKISRKRPCYRQNALPLNTRKPFPMSEGRMQQKETHRWGTVRRQTSSTRCQLLRLKPEGCRPSRLTPPWPPVRLGTRTTEITLTGSWLKADAVKDRAVMWLHPNPFPSPFPLRSPGASRPTPLPAVHVNSASWDGCAHPLVWGRLPRRDG